ncbi:acyl-CoA N-acyltransferase [Morchella snyderi]|nr:acyl-CoA N-acyltransferase [Morchella snyderi]
MPAMLDDPTAATLPAPTPTSTPTPTPVTLRDGTPATLYPVLTAATLPASLVAFLAAQFNAEIERGDTYPHDQPLAAEHFREYWFGAFGAVLLLGACEEEEGALLREGSDWPQRCLGTFYVKPNYPGRCAHVCNAGFLTVPAARGRGCGSVMGREYLKVAKTLGYTYSVFNLVFETNVASLRIWDGLGFERIGRVKGAARLKSYPGRMVDAFMIGKEL